jgi:succinate dehydrogenase / fumarate reductase membrane anchor subunit
MTQNFGTKRIVVGAHYGLRDWLAQRVTALLMALFTLLVLVQLLMPGELGYDRWAGVFASQWMKVLSFVVILSLALHAWVGVRDILMDYVKPVGVRLLAQVLAIVWLLACAGWAVQVLWRL